MKFNQPYTGKHKDVPMSPCLLSLTVCLWPSPLQPLAGRQWDVTAANPFSFQLVKEVEQHINWSPAVWKEGAGNLALIPSVCCLSFLTVFLSSYLFFHILMKEEPLGSPRDPLALWTHLNPQPCITLSTQILSLCSLFCFLLPGDSTWLPVLSEHSCDNQFRGRRTISQDINLGWGGQGPHLRICGQTDISIAAWS